MNSRKQRDRPWIGEDTLGASAVTVVEMAKLFQVTIATASRYLESLEKELTGTDNPINPVRDSEGRLIKREIDGYRSSLLYDRSAVMRLLGLLKEHTKGPDKRIYIDREGAMELLKLSPAVFNATTAPNSDRRDPTFPQALALYDNRRRHVKNKGWLSKYHYWTKRSLVEWMKSDNYKKLPKVSN